MPTADGQLTSAELAQVLALVQAQAVIREQLTQIAVAGALAPLRVLRSWWDTTEVTLAALQILRIVQPAQLRMAQVTDAYLSRVLSTMLGQPVRPIGAVDVTQLRRALTPGLARLLDRRPVELTPDGELNVDRFFLDDEEPPPELFDEDDGDLDGDEDLGDGGDVQLRAVDPVEVYARIAAGYRFQVTEGVAAEQALRDALHRAETVARTDVTLAMRAQANQVLTRTDERIRGYRRILHPELGSGGPPCGLCIVAADRVYRREDLDKIHEHCRCTVLPIVGSNDPGLQLNREDLDRLYRAAGESTSGLRLKRVRALITEHGELGPILVEAPRSGRIRGPRRVARDSTRGRVLSPQERISGLLVSTARLRERVAAGERRLAPAVDYQVRLIEQLRRDMAAA